MKIDSSQLNRAIDIYRKYLPNGDLQIFDISTLDCIGIPIYVAALHSSEVFLHNGVGYGGDSTEALVGALGELSETYHFNKVLKTAATCESISYLEMVKQFGVDHVVDPLSLCLSAGYPYHEQLPLRWVLVNRFGDDAQCWMPREAVAFSGSSYNMHSTNVELQSSKAAARLFPSITCGLGAGLSIEQALSHSVLELLQRDGNCTSFRAMDKGIDIELDVVKSHEIRDILLKLQNIGLRVRVKLASTEFNLVNLYVIAEPNDGCDPNQGFPIFVTSCGEAVHQNRERALRKALQEFISSRSRKAFMHGSIDAINSIVPFNYLENNVTNADPRLEEQKSLLEMALWLSKSESDLIDLLRSTVFSCNKSVLFSSLPSVADEKVLDATNRLKDLTDRLATQNISIYYLDGSPEGDDSPKVVKAMAPGLEGETLSYWRIGYRGAKRLLDSQSSLVTRKAPESQNLLIPLQYDAQEALGGPVYFRVSEWEKILHGLYPLYREPSAHTAQKYLQKNAI